VDRDDLRTIRRAELLARLEILDELIKEQASRAELVRQMGWDATLHEKRSELLHESRQQYRLLLRELFGEDRAREGDANRSTPSR
jgi:hypothetical protein